MFVSLLLHSSAGVLTPRALFQLLFWSIYCIRGCLLWLGIVLQSSQLCGLLSLVGQLSIYLLRWWFCILGHCIHWLFSLFPKWCLGLFWLFLARSCSLLFVLRSLPAFPLLSLVQSGSSYIYFWILLSLCCLACMFLRIPFLPFLLFSGLYLFVGDSFDFVCSDFFPLLFASADLLFFSQILHIFLGLFSVYFLFSAIMLLNAFQPSLFSRFHIFL